jgi:hypothetical protein
VTSRLPAATASPSAYAAAGACSFVAVLVSDDPQAESGKRARALSAILKVRIGFSILVVGIPYLSGTGDQATSDGIIGK